MPVSVVILTCNEEVNIADCLRSCSWSDDVHVIDSGSTDRTIEIARSMGAKVCEHPFKTFATQRNWAIDELKCKHPWQYHLDADERCTPEQVAEILAAIGPDGAASDKTAYLVPSRLMFFGKWLRRSGGYPGYQARLIRSDQCRFIDFGHGQREKTDGRVGRLVQPYMHYPFNKGLTAWLLKHNHYSDLEAANANQLPHMAWALDLFSLDHVARRRALKTLSFRFRGRSLLRFLYQFVFKKGFLEGRAGLNYCRLMSIYESWIERKMHHPPPDLTATIERLIETARASSTAEPKTLAEADAAIQSFCKSARTLSKKTSDPADAALALVHRH